MERWLPKDLVKTYFLSRESIIYGNWKVLLRKREWGLKKKKKTRSEIKSDDLEYAKNIIKFLIPYLGSGYVIWHLKPNLQRLLYPALIPTPPMKTGNREGAWTLLGLMGVTKQFVSLASHISMAAITDKAHLGPDWRSAVQVSDVHATMPSEKHLNWSQCNDTEPSLVSNFV